MGRCGDGGRGPCSPTLPLTPTPPPPSLLQTLSTQFRQEAEQTQGRQSWTYQLVQFADMLLNHSRNAAPLTPFTTKQRQAWDR